LFLGLLSPRSKKVKTSTNVNRYIHGQNDNRMSNMKLTETKKKKHARIQAPIALEGSISLTSSEVVENARPQNDV